MCSIYSSPADQLRVLVPFFRGALLHGEQCLYLADPERGDQVSHSLAGPNWASMPTTCSIEGP